MQPGEGNCSHLASTDGTVKAEEDLEPDNANDALDESQEDSRKSENPQEETIAPLLDDVPNTEKLLSKIHYKTKEKEKLLFRCSLLWKGA